MTISTNGLQTSMFALVICWLGVFSTRADPFMTDRSPPNGELIQVLTQGTYTIRLQIHEEGALAMEIQNRRKMVHSGHRSIQGMNHPISFSFHLRHAGLPVGSGIVLSESEALLDTWSETLRLRWWGDPGVLRGISILPAAHNTITIFLAGDSTVMDQPVAPYASWGQVFPAFFKESVAVANHAHSGANLLGFLESGRLEKIHELMRPGDYLFLQFAHNDQKDGPFHAPAYGLYQELLRHYIRETRHRGGRPVLVTPMVRRRFSPEGALIDTMGNYPQAMHEVAREEKVPLLDLHAMSISLLENLGPEDSRLAFLHFGPGAWPEFPEGLSDDSHFSLFGAWWLAHTLAGTIQKILPELAMHLRSEYPAFKDDSFLRGERLARLAAAGLPESRRPRLVLIGDSTVKVGTPGQSGWGEKICRWFDPKRIEVVNRAIGGRSSRTFYTEGRWQEVLDTLEPGDFVLIQFGHNDGGPINDTTRARGTLPGIGDETQNIQNLLIGREEEVHTYGWYWRRYLAGARSVGAIPVICSPVPRKVWREDGTLARSTPGYAEWARQVAEEEGAYFLDLNELIAQAYESIGHVIVDTFFADERTHTNETGAAFSARVVVGGLRQLPGRPVDRFLNQEDLP